jgi:Elongation factor G, domain IV
MDIYNKWFEDLMQRKGRKWKGIIRVQGEGKRYGPTTWFAKVILEFSPSNEFEVGNLLEPGLAKIAYNEEWYDFIIYGVLDILLVSQLEPIKDLKLTICQIEYNETESNSMAFRLAARNAALKALEVFDKSP